MNYMYDIYKRLPEDRLLWVNRVNGIEQTGRLVAALQTASTDYYLVCDSTERAIVDALGAQLAGLRQPPHKNPTPKLNTRGGHRDRKQEAERNYNSFLKPTGH